MKKSVSAPTLCGAEASLGVMRRTVPLAVTVSSASLKKAASCAAGLASSVSTSGFHGKDFIPALRAPKTRESVVAKAFIMPDLSLANVVNSGAMEHVVKEADELLIEAGYGGLLTGAECFELYGFQPLDAPSLKFSAADNKNSDLAACLATPTMADERNLGELVQESVRRMAVENNLNVQLRYAEELQRDKGDESRRRRRRPSEDLAEALMAEEALMDVGITADWGASLPAMPPLSPATKSLLSTLHSEEEHGARNTLMVCDGDYCWPVELGTYELEEPDESLFLMEDFPLEDFPPACLTPTRRSAPQDIPATREVRVGV